MRHTTTCNGRLTSAAINLNTELSTVKRFAIGLTTGPAGAQLMMVIAPEKDLNTGLVGQN